MAVVHQHGLPLEATRVAESSHRQILDHTHQRHMEHLQEVHAQNHNEVQQMMIALSIAQSDYSRLESSAAGVTNAQAEELASLRNQSFEEISVARQKLGYAEQHAWNSERQIHMMQQEVIAHNNERARIAEPSPRQVSDIQEDKIKLLSDQMQELMSRLDRETKYRARLEAQNADLRARTEQQVHPIHIGTPPGLPDTNRESTTTERQWMPLIPPEGVASLPPERAEPNQDDGPCGGEPPRGPCDDDGDDDDDYDSNDDRRRNKDKKKKKDKGRKKSRRRRRRRSPSSHCSSTDSSDSSASSSGKGLDKKAVKKLIKALTGAASSSKDDPESDKPRVKETEKIVSPALPHTESYRNWRLRAREAVVAASDRTD